MDKSYYVYIMASSRNGTLYIGVTNDLARRVFDHKSGKGSVFTKKHKVNLLVYCETFSTAYDAICREKQLKRWNRKWKLELIEQANLNWQDLSKEYFRY